MVGRAASVVSPFYSMFKLYISCILFIRDKDIGTKYLPQVAKIQRLEISVSYE